MIQPREVGFIESGQRLVQPDGRNWNQQQLLAAARRAELHHTGWPIGLVLDGTGYRPTPTPNGIEARNSHTGSGGTEDYWSLRTDGSYYVSRLFEEDFNDPPFTNSRGHPDLSIWFDLRIRRITEVILHSATLYRELDIAPDEPFVLSVNHRGLLGREFYVSTPSRGVIRGRTCQSPTATWIREVTQDYVTSNIKSLVGEAANGLFVLFDFARIEQQVVDELVDDFLSHRF